MNKAKIGKESKKRKQVGDLEYIRSKDSKNFDQYEKGLISKYSNPGDKDVDLGFKKIGYQRKKSLYKILVSD